VLSDRLEIDWYYQFWRWNNGGELPVILARITGTLTTENGTLELDTFFPCVLESQLDTGLEQLWTCCLLCDLTKRLGT
jgi:hypothetical protein